MNILVADDEVSIVKILSAYLRKEKFNVYEAKDGQEALEIIEKNKIDLAILDWMMPKVDGLEVCEYIKERTNIKVLILTAKSQNEDELKALNFGADEYIKKPFDPRILIARVKKLINYKNIIQIKNIKIDLEAKRVYKDDQEIILTKKEFELLGVFISNIGITMTREKLLDLVWGFDYDGDYRTVDTHIRRLRSKIGENIIRTYRGIGYILEENND